MEKILAGGATVLVDNRSDAERVTHNVAVGGTDRFMSGWGQAKSGYSYAFWACEPADYWRVKAWVDGRGDLMRKRTVWDVNAYRPSMYCAHCHVYVVRAGHPALK